MLIDLSNDFYIAKLSNKQDQALFDSPWMIIDHYLHVRRSVPNFVPESAEITTLPVWVRFPFLPVEYYNERWLRRAGDRIGKTLKVDDTTRAASRGKFV